MHRLISSSRALVVAACLAAIAGCGNKKPAETTKSDPPPSGDTPKTDGDADAGAAADEPKKDDCTGFEMSNLEDVLSKSSCEKAGQNPDSIENVDMKGKLEVTLTATPSKVPPGGKVDLLITFTNKSKDPLTLFFKIDPVPRFEIEAYDKKNKRVDMPAGNPPPLPAGVSQPPPAEAKTARVTLAPNGSARVRRAWEAVKMKWAPEKARGTPPEKGFPRKPAGSLGKGKFVLKATTALVGVADPEGKLVTPQTEIEVGN